MSFHADRFAACELVVSFDDDLLNERYLQDVTHEL